MLLPLLLNLGMFNAPSEEEEAATADADWAWPVYVYDRQKERFKKEIYAKQELRRTIKRAIETLSKRKEPEIAEKALSLQTQYAGTISKVKGRRSQTRLDIDALMEDTQAMRWILTQFWGVMVLIDGQIQDEDEAVLYMMAALL